MRVLTVSSLVLLAGSALAQAAVLNISNGQPGYTTMVEDAALRSEGTVGSGLWADGNIGNATGFGSHRMYPDVNFPGGRGPRRYVTWFDVSSIPAGSIINSATMSLFFQRSSSGAQAITGYQLSKFQSGKDWNEGVGQAPATDGSVTWNSQASMGTPWATPGATGATDIDLGSTITFDKAGGGLSEWKDFNVAAWVQSWVNTPVDNTGTLLWGGAGPAGPTDNYYAIIGKETTDGSSANKPMLIIDYTLVPEPTSLLLVAAGMLPFMRRRRTA